MDYIREEGNDYIKKKYYEMFRISVAADAEKQNWNTLRSLVLKGPFFFWFGMLLKE